jgi:hypothetical protein
VQAYDADLDDLADGALSASKIDTGILPATVQASSVALAAFYSAPEVRAALGAAGTGANTLTGTQDITASGEDVYSITTSSGIKINSGNLEVVGSSSTLAGNAIMVSLGGVPMMLQSGSGTLTGGSESIVFTTPFALGSTPIVVLTRTTNLADAMYVSAASDTGFTANGTDTETYNWIAIGPAPYAP